MARAPLWLWAADLDTVPANFRRAEAALSPDETLRLERYRKADDRRRFIRRRASLRVGLGTLLGVAPDRIRFGYSELGKPYLLEPKWGRLLNFNLAHSGDLAVFGCTVGYDIGIDVEIVCERDDLSAVAEACFSRREREVLAAVPPLERTTAFYRCWTRKEAFAKAIGTGLRAKLDDFDVSFSADAPPALLRVGWQPLAPAQWRLQALEVPPGYVGAVIVGTEIPTQSVN